MSGILAAADRPDRPTDSLEKAAHRTTGQQAVRETTSDNSRVTHAGPYAKKRSCNVHSFASMLGSGPEQTIKFPIASYIKSAGDAPCNIFWRELLDDFDYCSTGVFIGPWNTCLIFGKGDLEVDVSWGLMCLGRRRRTRSGPRGARRRHFYG